MNIYKKYRIIKKKSIRKKLLIILSIFLFLIISFIFYYFKVVCPIVIGVSQEKIRSVSTNTISKVVGDVLDKEKLTYNDFVNISYSQNGKIELIQVDTIKVNHVIRKMTKYVQEDFDLLGKTGLKISLGTFTGIPFLFGQGPNIGVKLVPIGTIETNVKTAFEESGINQTLHRLFFVITANVGMILPISTKNFITNLEVLLCESLIIGEIPEIYLKNS